MSKLEHINSAFPAVQSLYGIDPDPDEFEDLAYTAWERIGNKHTRLYRYIANTKNKELKLPCNVAIIESVHIPLVDAQVTSNKTYHNDVNSVVVEHYIDVWKFLNDPYNQWGKLLKYKEGGDTLYFNRDYCNVMVVYHGIIVDDEDGLPLITEKEKDAIATFIAYVEVYKDALRKRDKNSIILAQDIKAEWLRRCNAARQSEYLSQNDMNSILDVKYRWDRKQYGKSHLPII